VAHDVSLLTPAFHAFDGGGISRRHPHADGAAGVPACRRGKQPMNKRALRHPASSNRCPPPRRDARQSLRRHARLGVLTLAGALAACSVGPTFRPPPASNAAGYEPGGTAALTPVAGAPTQRLVITEKLAADWWTLFHSPALDALVRQAMANNPGLAAAEDNLRAAQDVATAARGALYPQIDAAAGAERQRQNYAAFGLKLPAATFNTFSIGPAVSYSLDLFGKNRRMIEERTAQADLAGYRRDATYLALTGNVVSDALMIASLRAQIKAVTGIIDDDEHTLALVRQRAGVGLVGDADVARAEAQLAGDRMALPPLRQRLSIVRHAFSVLEGKTPAAWQPPEFSLDSLTLPDTIPVALPSRLVHRRPDILAAEAELHAASASVGVATAAMYPDITLTASATQIASAQVFTMAGSIWSLAAGISAPLFHGGALSAQKHAAEANEAAALQGYRQTVLQAFAQVADTLDALRHDTELLSDARATLRAADRSEALTRQNYAVGAIGLTDLLDAQRVRQHALIADTQAAAQRYVDTADLFLAMGGGWWNRRPAQHD
jgi:NodT family efflux transporter outer membrane factor (OMF) lipoprotein